MSLSPEQRREYRGIAHNLKPVIIVGDKGLSEGLQDELERALNDHELIKVKLVVGDREARQAVAESICAQTGAALIQSMGGILLLLRRTAKPDPRLSNLIRH